MMRSAMSGGHGKATVTARWWAAEHGAVSLGMLLRESQIGVADGEHSLSRVVARGLQCGAQLRLQFGEGLLDHGPGVDAAMAGHRYAAVTKIGGWASSLLLDASGGAGSTLVQLARHAGMTVIGTASPRHHDTVRQLGAIPVDYRDPEMYQRIRELAPSGVDAVFGSEKSPRAG
jgi:hypothetical protein